ncbi:hypothetical protein [Bosea sp. (in: a-proteobacteria)]|uniref:hypothetical protein n=1 Tax=Bosea sp. (in: a-proteobacteria) TaxID=1871050 RepID=UPI002B46137B|nr:hypothetical protein [Bosea sp. (in: a-proteobacteria)]WRH56679.1 MAG: hypothetical protein RSE11_16755 [Bosea sp. (in: a-proteobacteria)]
MTVQGFQFAVTSRTQASVQVFVVAASTQSNAERLLERDQSLPAGSTIELQRQMSAEALAKYGLASGGVIKIR